jgi:hypothetical protein
VLSADGARLAAYEGIVLRGEDCAFSMYTAYAVFEHALDNGEATRRMSGQSQFAGEIFYDRTGALFVTRYDPVFAHPIGVDGALWTGRDSAGRTTQRWGEQHRPIVALRIGPGETMPEWPTPISATGAPGGGIAVRALDDGRIAVYGATTPGRPYDWYDASGRPQAPTRTIDYRYFAIAADGSSELLSVPGLSPDAGRTGGADISSDARFFAEIVSGHIPQGVRPGGEAWDFRNELRVYENGERTLTTPVATLLAGAPTIILTLDRPPLLPTIQQPHRAP